MLLRIVRVAWTTVCTVFVIYDELRTVQFNGLRNFHVKQKIANQLRHKTTTTTLACDRSDHIIVKAAASQLAV